MVRLGCQPCLTSSPIALLRQQRDLAGKRIGGAEHPAVAMIAAHHPLIGIGRSVHRGDDVVERLETPVGFDGQMHRRGPGPTR